LALTVAARFVLGDEQDIRRPTGANRSMLDEAQQFISRIPSVNCRVVATQQRLAQAVQLIASYEY
jgi:hypothetical protein